MGDAENVDYVLATIETVHGYRDYIPIDTFVDKPEIERFDDAIEKVERAVKMLEPEDVEAYREREDLTA